jgi:hypothetical protein
LRSRAAVLVGSVANVVPRGTPQLGLEAVAAERHMTEPEIWARASLLETSPEAVLDTGVDDCTLGVRDSPRGSDGWHTS